MSPDAKIDKAIKISRELFKKCYRQNKIRHKYKMKRRTYHFAFIFKRKKIISIGMNNPYDFNSRTKYFGYKYNIPKYKVHSHAHAELDALSKCWGKINIDSSYTMVVIRLNSKGEFCDSKPCKNCENILNKIMLKEVWWSNSSGEIRKK